MRSPRFVTCPCTEISISLYANARYKQCSGKSFLPIVGSLLCRVSDIIRLVPTRFDTLRPRQDGRHFADDTFKRIFLKENVRTSIRISLKFVPINNIPALVQIMAWRRPGDKPLSEPMMVSLLTHLCVTRPQ